MPAPRPRLRDAPRVPAARRLELLRAAVADEPALEVDDRELAREGPTVTADTLEDLRAEHREASLVLILGMDAFARLPSWRRWETMLDLAHLAVARRPGSEVPVEGPVASLLAARLVDDPAELRRAPAGRVLLQSIPGLDISATRLRGLVAAGRNIRYLVPDRVRDLILQHGLYAHAD
jgi:nicotinate-nucleotide adenylyltransferase